MSRISRFMLYAGSTVAGLSGIGYYMKSTRNYVSGLEQLAIEPSRTVRTGLDKTGLKLTLYQYQTCPFCSKVRSFLNYHGIDYDVVEVNPLTRRQIQFSDWKKVPIVLVDGQSGKQQLNDSTLIVSFLNSYLQDKTKSMEELSTYYPVQTSVENGTKETKTMNIYNTMFFEKEVNDEKILREITWRKWADQVFVHMLSPNVYRTPKESFEAFNWYSEAGNWEENFSNWERFTAVYVGAVAMFVIGKMLKKKYQLKDDVRQSLYDSCQHWTKNLKGQKFNGGDSPNLADLAVYGMLNSIEGTSTFYDSMNNTKIGTWYNDMKKQVESHAGSNILLN